VGSSIVKTGRPPFAQAAIRFFCTVATQSLLLSTGGSAKPDDATAHGLPLHSAPLIPREAGQRTSKDWIHQVTVSQSAPTRLTKIREFSYERGCQAKKLPAAPRKGKLFGVHPARCPRLSVTRPVAVISRRFHVSDGGSTPSAREASQAEVLAPDNVPTMILCETRGL
jgi:hypothetical protein